jgi:hypothetical protein
MAPGLVEYGVGLLAHEKGSLTEIIERRRPAVLVPALLELRSVLSVQ